MEDTEDDLTFEDDVSREPTLSDREIKDVQNKIRELDKYPIEETKTRNIIMLGRSGSGKSTATSLIKDICAKPAFASLFSETVEPRFQSFSLDDKDNACKYTLNITDTPGVQEVKPMGENARSDDAIIETVKYCLKNEVTRIHALMIFASFEQRITQPDIIAFKTYLDMFYDERVSIGICITRSEGKDKEWEEKTADDLKRHRYFNEVLNRPNIQILFSGCIDETKIKESKDVRTLFKHYNEIYNKRKKNDQLHFWSIK